VGMKDIFRFEIAGELGARVGSEVGRSEYHPKSDGIYILFPRG